MNPIIRYDLIATIAAERQAQMQREALAEHLVHEGRQGERKILLGLRRRIAAILGALAGVRRRPLQPPVRPYRAS